MAYRGKIYESIVDTIGSTPLVRVPRLSREEGYVPTLLKLEFFKSIIICQRPHRSCDDRGGRTGGENIARYNYSD